MIYDIANIPLSSFSLLIVLNYPPKSPNLAASKLASRDPHQSQINKLVVAVLSGCSRSLLATRMWRVRLLEVLPRALRGNLERLAHSQ